MGANWLLKYSATSHSYTAIEVHADLHTEIVALLTMNSKTHFILVDRCLQYVDAVGEPFIISVLWVFLESRIINETKRNETKWRLAETKDELKSYFITILIGAITIHINSIIQNGNILEGMSSEQASSVTANERKITHLVEINKSKKRRN